MVMINQGKGQSGSRPNRVKVKESQCQAKSIKLKRVKQGQGQTLSRSNIVKVKKSQFQARSKRVREGQGEKVREGQGQTGSRQGQGRSNRVD